MARGEIIIRQKRRRGRPTKLTPALQAKICDALRAGNYLETATAFAGIDKTTLYDWLRRGRRAHSGMHYNFVQAVEKAMADGEARDVALISKAAAEGVWQAAAWRLERKYPDRWGRHERHQVEAAILAVQVNPNDAVQELAGLLAARVTRSRTDEDP